MADPAKNIELYVLPPETQEEQRAQEHHGYGRSISSLAGWGILAAVVLALMASLIYGKVKISALYTQRAELEAQLAQLHGDNISLQSELAEKTNMTKVDEYARNELGLQKLDKSQIEYVRIDTPSVAEVKKDEDGGVFYKIREWFDSFEEYIGS